MAYPSNSEDREELQELLQQYENLKHGSSHRFLEEDAFERIIDYYADRDNIQEAQKAADYALEQFPFSAELMFRKADMLIANRKYEQALALLDTADIYDNNNISYYILKTDALLALDRQPEAITLLKDGLKKFEGEEKIDLLFELADVFDDYEEFDKVFQCLKHILELEPNNDEALYKICFWADFTGRLEESIKLHQKIIDEYPYNEIAWFNLAAGYQSLKLYEKAIDAYLYALAIDEKFEYAYRNMADAYMKLRKFKDAAEALERVLELAPPEDLIYEAIAHCYHKMGNVAQARFNYKKAVHLNNTDAKLHYKLASTYMQDEQWQLAVKHLTNALRLSKNNQEFNLAMGECKMKLKEFKEAIFYLGVAVKSKPKQASGWEALIKCLLTAGHIEDALTQCKIAIDVTGGKLSLVYYHAAILFLSGKNKEALLQLENAMQQNPKLLKKALELTPEILQNPKCIDIIARYKKKKKN